MDVGIHMTPDAIMYVCMYVEKEKKKKKPVLYLYIHT